MPDGVLRCALKNPKAIISHIRRESILAKMLSIDANSIREFINEAKRLIPNFHVHFEMPERSCQVLYAVVRTLKPEVMVETGISAGMSSRVILEAMQKNDRGRLYSIDPKVNVADRVMEDGKVYSIHEMLVDRPGSKRSEEMRARRIAQKYEERKIEIGYLVSENLRNRWDRKRGFSQDILPPLLQQLGTIDAFLHDSRHDPEIMSFEYSEAWKALRKGGAMLSDDIDIGNGRGTFQNFCKENNRGAYADFLNFGITIKN